MDKIESIEIVPVHIPLDRLYRGSLYKMRACCIPQEEPQVALHPIGPIPHGTYMEGATRRFDLPADAGQLPGMQGRLDAYPGSPGPGLGA